MQAGAGQRLALVKACAQLGDGRRLNRFELAPELVLLLLLLAVHPEQRRRERARACAGARAGAHALNANRKSTRT